MTHTHTWAMAAVAAALFSAPAAAQTPTYPTNPPGNAEMGRVLSSIPVLAQVAVPRQVCTVEHITRDGQKSGAGALMGGIAGGAMGNAVGDGSGRAVATMIGIVGGAILGNNIEGGGKTAAPKPPTKPARRATTSPTNTRASNTRCKCRKTPVPGCHCVYLPCCPVSPNPARATSARSAQRQCSSAPP